MKIDMHIHTKYSRDSVISPRFLIKTAIRKGLDCIAITDHDTTKGWKPCVQFSRKFNFMIIQGEEIKAMENGKKIGEILGYFLTEEIPPGNPMDIIDEIKSQGGISAIAHPFDRRNNRLYLFPEVIKKVDLIEGFNARTVFNTRNRKAMKLAEEFNKPVIAGSDAHTCWEIGNAYVTSSACTEEELRKYLLKGKIEITGKTTNPLVHVFSTIIKVKSFVRSRKPQNLKDVA